MVSSGTVTNDASTLEQYLNSYKSEISGLEGSWKGTSYDSITSQADAFVSEYSSIVTQMNNFASACESYEAYKSLKATIAKTEADRANAADSVKYTYDSPLAQMNNDLEKLKSNINTYLASASAISLTASAVNVGASAGISGLASTASSSTTAAENKAFIESILSEEGNTISDYSGFNDGQWCADFVSEMLNRNGYNIEPSSIAGHESDNTIFKSLERAGATIHLDQAAQYNGESADDYTPQPGDVVLFDFAYGNSPDGTTDHVGFVVKDNGDGTITTIEGNTSGAAGGSCVAIHDDRSRSEVYGYATPVKNHD